MRLYLYKIGVTASFRGTKLSLIMSLLFKRRRAALVFIGAIMFITACYFLLYGLGSSNPRRQLQYRSHEKEMAAHNRPRSAVASDFENGDSILRDQILTGNTNIEHRSTEKEKTANTRRQSPVVSDSENSGSIAEEKPEKMPAETARDFKSQDTQIVENRPAVLKIEEILLNNSYETLHALGTDDLANYWYDRPKKFVKEGFLDVIFLPFSHIDPGWGGTVDAYYTSRVRNIFNTVFPSLAKNPDYRFMVAEMIYLKRWYDEGSEADKEIILKIVKNGQLEIGTGGWCMPDEAVTHYQAVIDQLIYGHLWVRDTFNVTPRYGFANDPFGHSPTFAYLSKKAGLKAIFIHRIHQFIKRWFAEHGQQDFTWQQTWDVSHKSDITTHLLALHDYDLNNQCSTEANICMQYDFAKRGALKSEEQFLKAADDIGRGYRKLSTLYPTNKLLVLFGRDFAYQSQREWDSQMAHRIKIHEIINNNTDKYKMKIRFGTMHDYFSAVENEVSVTKSGLLKVSGDFFTYSDRGKTYWSGFYTSRPYSKYVARALQRLLIATDVLLSKMLVSKESQSVTVLRSVSEKLAIAREQLGVFQHHDAITGTSNGGTTADFLKRLNDAVTVVEKVLQEMVLVMQVSGSETTKNLLVNDPIYKDNAAVKTKSEMSVTVFNPTGYYRHENVRMAVDSPCWTAGEEFPLQTNPIFLSSGEIDQKRYQIVVSVKLNPFQRLLLRLKKVSCSGDQTATVTFVGKTRNFTGPYELKVTSTTASDKTFTFYAKKNVVKFDDTFRRVTLSQDQMSEAVFVLDPIEYEVNAGGPYIFEPRNVSAKLLDGVEGTLVRFVEGLVVSEVHFITPLQQWIVSFCHDLSLECSSLHLQTRTDLQRQRNLEVGFRLKSSIKSRNIMYTDLNGFQMSKRQYHKHIPLEGNFYPMTSAVYIQGESLRLSILSREAHAVSSLTEGEMQIMLDRVLSQDDNKGIGQGIYDPIPVTNSFKIRLEKTPKADQNNPRISNPSGTTAIANELFQAPVISILTDNVPNYFPFTEAPRKFPCSLSLVGLRHVGFVASTATHRFIAIFRRHAFSVAENMDSCGSGSSLDVSLLFPVASVTSIRHTSLTSLDHYSVLSVSDSFEIEPNQIESYLVEVKPN